MFTVLGTEAMIEGQIDRIEGKRQIKSLRIGQVLCKFYLIIIHCC